MRIIFAGTPNFATPALEALIHAQHDIIGVYTQADRPSGRGRHIHASPVKTLALQHHLPIFQPHTLRDPLIQQALRDLQADLMIVAAYGYILPAAILNIPARGCINIHASLLPRWRGAAPIHRAILAGDTETGITIMQMAEGLDTGPILSQAVCPIESRDSLKILHDKLATLGAECLLSVLENRDHITPHPQDESLATYASKISKQEAELHFQKNAVELERAVRAFYPAYTYLKGQLVKIWEAQYNFSNPPPRFARLPPLEKGAEDTILQANKGAAGTILQANSEGIDVQTGHGILRLLKLQLPGGKILSVREMLNARANLFAKGYCFGRSPDEKQAA